MGSTFDDVRAAEAGLAGSARSVAPDAEGRTIFSGLHSLARRREMILSRLNNGPNALDTVVERYPTPTTAIIDGREFIMMGSNNYLGLPFSEPYKEAVQRATADFGVGTTASRVASGTTTMHVGLERDLAEYLGKDHAVAFSTGFQTNLGVLAGLAQSGDVLMIDADCHASIFVAAALSPARKIKFRHNDVADLRQKLEAPDIDPQRTLIVTESIFSAMGDEAPLREIVALKREFGAFLAVDEAHSFGLYGDRGEGLSHSLGIAEDVDIFILTFSKSLGLIGGAAISSHPDFDCLKYAARAFLFTAALPSSLIAAARQGISMLRDDAGLRRSLWSNVDHFRERIKGLGLAINDDVSPIVAVTLPGLEVGYRVWRQLYDAGVYANALLPPATPPDTHIIRFSLSAAHSTEQLDRVADALGECVAAIPELRHLPAAAE
jgi:8-amino-7-oxononanoate synthase